MSLILKMDCPTGDIILHFAENRFELSRDFGVKPPILLEDFIVNLEKKFSKEGLKFSFISKEELKEILLQKKEGKLKCDIVT